MFQVQSFWSSLLRWMPARRLSLRVCPDRIASIMACVTPPRVAAEEETRSESMAESSVTLADRAHVKTRL